MKNLIFQRLCTPAMVKTAAYTSQIRIKCLVALSESCKNYHQRCLGDDWVCVDAGAPIEELD